LFEADPVARQHGFVEREARFGAVPVDEFADRVFVGALRTAGGRAVENCSFRLFEIQQFQDTFRRELALFVCHSRSLHDAAKAPGASKSTLARY
jgi:hypothetical protein